MRTATVNRNTNETGITASLCLEGGDIAVSTGIGFLDHMLTAWAMHAGFGLRLDVSGDLEVDCHHTVEDTGIVLGQALRQALGDAPLMRYGTFFIPMDESLAMCSLDLSNRPYLVFNVSFLQAQVGGFDTCMTEEFFRALAVNAGMTLHLRCLHGSNAHHQIEALFKAFAHALQQAVQPKEGVVLSTKGTL